MQKVIFVLMVVLTSCSMAQIRSTVDSYGEQPIARDQPIHFVFGETELLDQQAAQSCQRAATDLSLKVVSERCDSCLQVVLKSRLAGTQQVIRASPGFGSSWGIGIASQATSSQEAGREIKMQFFTEPALKNPVREIQIRSVGRENSVSAVAYEMCQAAFQDYPQNIEGRFYEIKARKP